MKVIKVKNLSKNYRIGRKKQSYYSIREEITNLAKKPWQYLKGKSFPKEKGNFWALKDINFSIRRGEVVGIIGRNGAGKTTLLKILSRITPPAEGEAIIKGRISSLLEVGTGFHPELNGRENIYLNGAILGMSRKEIDSKFNEIVEFAEIRKFLETPVKRYSSGMYVRLAFAVAAHLEPEILLVDEVLAVGDYKFQKKCLDKMHKVSTEGRTVLFISHNMISVTRLCSRAILLEGGKLIMQGPVPNVIDRYIGLRRDIGPEIIWKDSSTAPGDNIVKLKSVRILSKESKPINEFKTEEDIFIEFCYWSFREEAKLLPFISLINNEGIKVLTAVDTNLYKNSLRKGFFRSLCKIPGNLLNEGHYFVNVFIRDFFETSTLHVNEERVISFEAIETKGIYKEYAKNLIGVIRPKLDWKTEYQGPLK